MAVDLESGACMSPLETVHTKPWSQRPAQTSDIFCISLILTESWILGNLEWIGIYWLRVMEVWKSRIRALSSREDLFVTIQGRQRDKVADGG